MSLDSDIIAYRMELRKLNRMQMALEVLQSSYFDVSASDDYSLLSQMVTQSNIVLDLENQIVTTYRDNENAD